jgi:hypothetical protein
LRHAMRSISHRFTTPMDPWKTDFIARRNGRGDECKSEGPGRTANEFHLRAKESAGPKGRFATAGGLIVLTDLMGVGIFGVVTFMWRVPQVSAFTPGAFDFRERSSLLNWVAHPLGFGLQRVRFLTVFLAVTRSHSNSAAISEISQTWPVTQRPLPG